MLEGLGATYAGTGIVTDGNIITADGPQSARLFGKTIASALEKES
jgi:protease I